MKIVRHTRITCHEVVEELIREGVITSSTTTTEPLKKKNPAPKNQGIHCNRCGKVFESSGLTTIVEIAHGGTSTVNYPHDGKFRICKDCERWLLDELAYNKKGGVKNDYI